MQLQQLAQQGFKESSRFHLFGRTERNLAAADQALDQISLQTGPSELDALRALGKGLAPENKLAVEQTVLKLAAHGNISKEPTASALDCVWSNLYRGSKVDADRPQIDVNSKKYLADVAAASQDADLRFVVGLHDVGATTQYSIYEQLAWSRHDARDWAENGAEVLTMADGADRYALEKHLAQTLQQLTSGTSAQQDADLIARLPDLIASEPERDTSMELAFEIFGRGGSRTGILEAVKSWTYDPANQQKLDAL